MTIIYSATGAGVVIKKFITLSVRFLKNDQMAEIGTLIWLL